MRRFARSALLVCAALLSAVTLTATAQTRPAKVTVPVVLSRDTSSPTAVIGVYYNIGFRIEPKDRTGFAHLFEHMSATAQHHG